MPDQPQPAVTPPPPRPPGEHAGADEVALWADAVLARPAAGGPFLELRHVLDEAAHPETVAALRRLASAA
ncbi:hypothetical protein ACFVFS_24035 [Kitasatospora sp. NPDC057692]|uniref:hypothetical protein n=1 Tax=Kitasatospora sp. NPDC057692 TaxID=3346215 RepID=UPI0036A2D61D